MLFVIYVSESLFSDDNIEETEVFDNRASIKLKIYCIDEKIKSYLVYPASCFSFEFVISRF